MIKVGTQPCRGKSNTSEKRIEELVAAREPEKQGSRSSWSVWGGWFRMAQTSVRPKKIAQLQALAAVGQSHLMSCYGRLARSMAFTVLSCC